MILICAVSPSIAQAASKVLLFGDSLSAGHSLKPEEKLPVLLQQAFDKSGADLVMSTASKGGETTEGGLARLPGALQRHKPDIVVLELGGNDFLRKWPVDTTRANLNAMLSLIRESGARAVLVALEIPAGYPGYDQAYLNAQNALYPAMAKQHNVPLYPFFLTPLVGNPAYMMKDGIHPSAAGVRVIAPPLAAYLIEFSGE